MRANQRGVISAYVYLAGAIAILGLLSGMAYMAKSYIEDYGKGEHARGIAEERVRWEARESKELADANRTIVFLNAAYREREQRFAVEINGLSAKHEEEKRNAKAKHDRDVAAVRDGFRLSDPGARPAPACEGGGESAPATAFAAAGQPDAKGGGELSESLTGFLLAEANRADAIVGRLGEIQDLVTKYWTACSAPKAGTPP